MILIKRLVVIAFLLQSIFCTKSHAVDKETWQDISDITVTTLMTSALLVPSAQGDWEGTKQALYSLAFTQGVAILTKSVVHAKRPDLSDNRSFPSGHTASAFASATTLYRRYGWEIGFPAYALATLTGSARVAGRKHHWYDALAGAALGSASGWYFTDALDENVQLYPWVDSKGAGIAFVYHW